MKYLVLFILFFTACSFNIKKDNNLFFGEKVRLKDPFYRDCEGFVKYRDIGTNYLYLVDYQCKIESSDGMVTYTLSGYFKESDLVEVK